MKKLLGAAVVFVLSLVCAIALAACNKTDSGKDAETAKKAVNQLKVMYGDKDTETPKDYEVLGQIKVDDGTYAITWTVSSEYSGYGDYIKVGTMNETNKQVTIGITRADDAIDYKLTASVTVGKSTESVDFTRKVPAKPAEHAGTLADPYSAENVIDIANSLETNAYLLGDDGNPKLVYTKGYVVEFGSDAGSRVGFVYIVDEYADDKTQNSTGALCVLSINYNDVLTKYSDLGKGDLIVVSGFIMNYLKAGSTGAPTPEITYYGSTNIYCVSLVKAEIPDEEKVPAVKESLALSYETLYEAGEYNLPTSKYTGVTIEWESKNTEYVTIVDGKLNVVKTPAEELEVTITATISCGSVSDTKDLTVKLVTPEAVETGTFVYAYEQVNLKQTLYFTGAIEGGYGVMTEDALEAAEIVVAKVDGGYTMKIGEKYLELDANYYLVLTDTSSQAWVYNYDLNVFTWVNGSATYYLGAYNEHNTLRASSITFISGSNAGTVGVSQFVAYFTAPAVDTRTDAEKIAAVKAALTLEPETFVKEEEVVLHTTNVKGVTIEWTITESEYASISDGKLIVSSIPDTKTTLTVTATITCGNDSDTKTFEIELTKKIETTGEGTAESPYTVADVKLIFSTLDTDTTYQVDGLDKLIYVEGYVTSAGTISAYGFSNVYIADNADTAATKTASLWVYSLNYSTVVPNGTVLLAGDKVIISGYLKNYRDDCEIANSGTTYPVVTSIVKVTLSDEQKVGLVLDNYTLPAEATEDITLPSIAATIADRVEGVELSFASDNDAIVVEDGKLTLVRGAADVSVKVTVTASLNGEEDTKEFTIIVKSASAVSAELSFASTDNRTSLSTTQQVWEQNGITFTNDKATSSNEVANFSNPVRLYQNSTAKIEFAGMTEIVFACNNTTYATALKNSIGTVAGVTVTVDGTTVTVKFDEARDSFEFTFSAQVRLNSLTVKG